MLFIYRFVVDLSLVRVHMLNIYRCINMLYIYRFVVDAKSFSDQTLRSFPCGGTAGQKCSIHHMIG